MIRSPITFSGWFRVSQKGLLPSFLNCITTSSEKFSSLRACLHTLCETIPPSLCCCINSLHIEHLVIKGQQNINLSKLIFFKNLCNCHTLWFLILTFKSNCTTIFDQYSMYLYFLHWKITLSNLSRNLVVHFSTTLSNANKKFHLLHESPHDNEPKL